MSTLSITPRPDGALWSRAALVLLATLLLHAFTLDWAQRALSGADSGPAPVLPVSARLLPPPEPVAAPEASAPPPAPKPRRAPVRRPQPAPAAPVAERIEAPVSVGEPPAEPLADPVVADAPAAAEELPAAEPVAAAEPPSEPVLFEATGEALRASLAALPDLRATLPSSARYVYRTSNSELRLASGTTNVEWSLAGDGHYDLRLSTTAVGITVLELHSQGTLRAFGLAPDRYTETRVRRGAMVANFDWEGGRITFSARPHERTLADGVQDRVSFQIQLMLLGQAQPERFHAGAQILLWMAGRDDLTSYRFRSAGREATATGMGRLDAVRLERITARETDARIDVWLVPSLGWLPVRLRFTDRLGRVTESVLESMPTS